MFFIISYNEKPVLTDTSKGKLYTDNTAVQ